MIYPILATFILSLPVAFATDPTCDSTDPLTPATICSIRAAFGGSQIVPNMLASFLPTALLDVTYGTVTLGGAQQMSPSRVNTAPEVAISQVSGTTMGPYYTLVMYDGTENTLNWLQTDLQADATTGDLVSTIDPLISYQSPAPASGTGLHDYLVLLYTQSSSTISMTAPALTGFNIDTWVSEYFPGTTTPCAGMFFKAEYDGVAFTTEGGAVATTAAATTTTKSATTSASSIITTTKSSSTKTTTTKSASATSGSDSTVSSDSASATSSSSTGGGNAGNEIVSGAARNSGMMGFVVVGFAGLIGSLIL